MLREGQVYYKQIIEYLRSRIEKQDYSLSEPIATEKTLSEKFGVSAITARRALDELSREGLIVKKRGLGCFVAEKDSSNEFAPIAPPSFGRGMAAIVLSLYRPKNGATEFLKGCTEYFSKRKILPYALNSYEDHEKEFFIDNIQGKRSILGCVYFIGHSSKRSLSDVYDIAAHGIPIVTVDGTVSSEIPSICCDNAGGGYLATKHLIECGHKNIAFFSEAMFSGSSTVRDRYFGYCKALTEAGIKRDDDLGIFARCNIHGEQIVETTYVPNPDEENFHEKYNEFLSEQIDFLLSRGVTAIQTSNDYTACNLVCAARRNNINIPDDLSIIGFDNNEFSKFCEIPLTTVEQDFYQLGYTASKLLVALTRNEEIEKHTVLPVKLVVKKSVCNINERKAVI